MLFFKRMTILFCLILVGSPVYANTNTFLFKKTFGFWLQDPVIWSVPVPSTNPHEPAYYKGTVSEIFIVNAPERLWVSIRKSDIQTGGSIRLLPLGNALNNVTESTAANQDLVIEAKDNSNQWVAVGNEDEDSFILIENAHTLPTAKDNPGRIILRVSLDTISRDLTPMATGLSVRIHKPDGFVAHSAAHWIRYTVSQSVFDRDADGDVDQADVDAGALDFDEDGNTDDPQDRTLHQGARDAYGTPRAVGTIPAQLLTKPENQGKTATIDVSPYFRDPESNTLTYTASSSDTTIATVSVSSATLTLTAGASGTATITVTATDPDSLSTTQTFSVKTEVIVAPAPTALKRDDGYHGATYFPIRWTAPSTLRMVTGYDVQYRVKGTSDFTDAGHTGTESTFRVSGLTPETTYQVRVRARLTNDFSSWSSLLEVSTRVRPPTNVTVSDISNVPGTADWRATISWTAPRSNSNIIKYRVIYTGGGTTALVEPTTTSVTLTGLTASTSYSGNIAAVVGSNSDDYGETVTFQFQTVQSGTADAISELSSQELSQLVTLFTYDTLIFNELHNGSDDANDWLELRNVSDADLPLDDWELTIRTADSNVVAPFPTGTAIPAGEVLLLTNTEMASADDMSVLSVVSEAFVLPQEDFALILRSPTVLGDLAGNYVQGEPLSTTPPLTVDKVWERTQPIVFGYRSEAWAVSTYQNGLGSPGYHPLAPSTDVNNDGLVNIFDLVLVASQFGTTSTTADLNRDGTVNIADLALVAGALGSAIGAPTANQSDAAVVNTWLKLARENAANVVKSSIPEGFSYERGIQVLEDLARALTPNATALLANYPNPFNPETWIPYQLSKAADVTITIYASDGNLVRTLAIGHRDVGMYKTRSQAAYWDGKNEMGESVASGVYFYTLTAGDFSATRKMLILK